MQARVKKNLKSIAAGLHGKEVLGHIKALQPHIFPVGHQDLRAVAPLGHISANMQAGQDQAAFLRPLQPPSLHVRRAYRGLALKRSAAITPQPVECMVVIL